MNLLKQSIIALFELIYPSLCKVCGKALIYNEKEICVHCIYHLPETGYWNQADNPMAKMLWGRVYIEEACALFFYQKGSLYDNLLFAVKYKGAKKTAEYLGQLLADKIQKNRSTSNIDGVIPVPLHKKRQRKRGYNQSACFGRGLAEVFHVPVWEEVLIRKINTPSQTTKTKEERRENVKSAFDVADNSPDLNYKHIILVDDVFTTGATLEACAIVLKNRFPNIRIQIITIAYTL